MRSTLYAIVLALMLGLAVAEVIDQTIHPLADRLTTIEAAMAAAE